MRVQFTWRERIKDLVFIGALSLITGVVIGIVGGLLVYGLLSLNPAYIAANQQEARMIALAIGALWGGFYTATTIVSEVKIWSSGKREGTHAPD